MKLIFPVSYHVDFSTDPISGLARIFIPLPTVIPETPLLLELFSSDLFFSVFFLTKVNDSQYKETQDEWSLMNQDSRSGCRDWLIYFFISKRLKIFQKLHSSLISSKAFQESYRYEQTF
jgi:hypothetical protein